MQLSALLAALLSGGSIIDLDGTVFVQAAMFFIAFGVLYANTTTLPGLLQSLFGYDATTSGLVLSPAGMFSVVALFTVGALMARGVDSRYFIGLGLLPSVLATTGCWQ